MVFRSNSPILQSMVFPPNGNICTGILSTPSENVYELQLLNACFSFASIHSSYGPLTLDIPYFDSGHPSTLLALNCHNFSSDSPIAKDFADSTRWHFSFETAQLTISVQVENVFYIPGV